VREPNGRLENGSILQSSTFYRWAKQAIAANQWTECRPVVATLYESSISVPRRTTPASKLVLLERKTGVIYGCLFCKTLLPTLRFSRFSFSAASSAAGGITLDLGKSTHVCLLSVNEPHCLRLCHFHRPNSCFHQSRQRHCFLSMWIPFHRRTRIYSPTPQKV